MNEANKTEALSIISTGVITIVDNYSLNALLINSCYVASDRYKSLPPKGTLSTTLNIPEEMRLDIELDVQYTYENLATIYTSDVLNIVLKNYVIVSVSIVDATLEELYEYFIKVFDPAITDSDLEKKIRNAWTNDNLLNFLIDPTKVNLQKPADLQTTFAEAIMRYNELRILRHTLLHTKGKLSDKNLLKLQNNLANTPAARKHLALIGSPLFNADHEIVLTINHVLAIRKYLHTFLTYVSNAVKERVI